MRIVTTGLRRIGLHFESIIIVIIIIIFTQCIYNYTPQTNHVPMLCTVAAILLLQYMAHVTLFPMLNVVYFTSVLSAVTMCVQCLLWLFCVVSEHRDFLVCCSGIVWVILRGCQLTPISNGISLLYIHRAIYFYLRSLYFRVFSASFLIALLLLLQSTCSRKSHSVRTIDKGLKRTSTLWQSFQPGSGAHQTQVTW